MHTYDIISGLLLGALFLLSYNIGIQDIKLPICRMT